MDWPLKHFQSKYSQCVYAEKYFYSVVEQPVTKVVLITKNLCKNATLAMEDVFVRHYLRTIACCGYRAKFRCAMSVLMKQKLLIGSFI